MEESNTPGMGNGRDTTGFQERKHHEDGPFPTHPPPPCTGCQLIPAEKLAICISCLPSVELQPLGRGGPRC